MHQARGRRCPSHLPPPSPTPLSLVNNDTGKNRQDTRVKQTRETQPHPRTTPTPPHASTHVDKNRAKTPTKQPKIATRQTRKPRTPHRCQGNQPEYSIHTGQRSHATLATPNQPAQALRQPLHQWTPPTRQTAHATTPRTPGYRQRAPHETSPNYSTQ